MTLSRISIIIPVYNEETHIRQTIDEIYTKLETDNFSYTFILVDDGSKDASWDKISSLKGPYGLKCIRLSRNFGKEAALCAGLEYFSDDACIIMDADLQHPPEIIPNMLSLWKEDSYQVVEAVKASRGKESLFNKLGASIFYSLLKKLSGIDLKNASDFKLLDKNVVYAWKAMKERNTFFRGMSAWVGYKRIQIPFNVKSRNSGITKWSPVKLLKLAINAITSFSSLPLQIVTIMGGLFLSGSLVLAGQTLYKKFSGQALSGFTTVILLLLIIGSTLMMSLGIIGTYLAKIYDEVKGRPRYLISKLIEKNGG